MSESKYTRSVERELQRVSKLIAERREEARMKDIALKVNTWEKKSLSTRNALDDIRRVVQAVPPPWSDTADPGVSVAQGVAEGLIGRKELSAATWNAIEVLIAVAEV